jgi:RNA recognition motif-containing protein
MSKTPSREKEAGDDARKVFITNIDGAHQEEAVEVELRKLFERFGAITKLNVKKNKNGLYSFAFLEFDSAEAALNAIKELDQFELFGKRMRVYFPLKSSRQDRQSEGCFHCKRPGHFAKECPQNRDSRYDPREQPRRDYRDDREREERY